MTFDLLLNYLYVGATLFALGMLGFLARRNLIVMFLSVEMMLQGVALSAVGFGRYHGTWAGQVLTIVVLTVAAGEAAVALALILILYNRRESLDIGLWKDLHEPSLPKAPDEPVAAEAEPLEIEPEPSLPTLVVAGVEPKHPAEPWLHRRR